MISDSSILYRLPPQLDRKQALFLDGIRHAAEIADIAHSRLQAALTKIALQDGAMSSRIYAAAFLDAWSLVDTVDRFRLLWKLMPSADFSAPQDKQHAFEVAADHLRKLRNVADHLAQRADYVVARNGTALGSLSWFTITDVEAYQGLLCVLVPGTAQVGSHAASAPAGKAVTFPSGHIQLSAGEHRANLSEAFACMAERVRALERGLAKALKVHGLEGQAAGADLVIRSSITFRLGEDDA